MITASKEVDSFVQALPEDRRGRIAQIREWTRKYADPILEECINYKMIGYVVPHSVFPDGYHCNPSDPLPFMNIGSMKHHIGFYHMGLFADPDLQEGFTQTYRELTGKKAQMGKSCLRLPLSLEVPEELIRKWCETMSAETWIHIYCRTREKA